MKKARELSFSSICSMESPATNKSIHDFFGVRITFSIPITPIYLQGHYTQHQGGNFQVTINIRHYTLSWGNFEGIIGF